MNWLLPVLGTVVGTGQGGGHEQNSQKFQSLISDDNDNS